MTIDSYLGQLGRSLSATRHERRRILAEVEDHLRESAAVQGETEALRRFGSVELVADRFRHELAVDATALAVRLAGVTALAFVALCAAIQSASVRAAVPRSLDAPYGPLTMVALELAGFVAMVTAVRWWRWRRAATVPPGAALAVVRGSLVVVAAAFVGGSLQFAALGSLQHFRGVPLVLTVGWLATCVAASMALGSAKVALDRVRLVGGTAPSDAFDDLVVVARHAPVVGGLVNAVTGRPNSLVARAVAALEPHRRPWRFAVVFALAVGLAFSVAQGLGENDASIAWRALLGGVLLFALQAAVVIAAYAVLGRFLGLRPPRRDGVGVPG